MGHREVHRVASRSRRGAVTMALLISSDFHLSSSWSNGGKEPREQNPKARHPLRVSMI